MDKLTIDAFFNGRIQVRQHRSGYRFSIDSILLAGHVFPRPGDTVLDLGTGCGIIPLILAHRNPGIKIYGVEVQRPLAELAVMNLGENRLEDRIEILCMDMKALGPGMTSGQVDMVVSNPPYRKAQTGRVNPDRQRAVARHEIKVTLPDVVDAARRMLRVSGRFVTIYPAERTTDLVLRMHAAGIEPKFLRMIYSGRRTGAKLVLVEGSKGARPGVKVGPPLIIYRDDGSYTGEVQRLFSPDFS